MPDFAEPGAEAALEDRARTLLGCFSQAAALADVGPRQGLDPETHATILADVLSLGFSQPIRSESGR